MNDTEARAFRAAYEGAVKRYSKMTKVQLRNEDLIALSETNTVRLCGGPVSKDELISDILTLRGYTTAKLNESTHVLAHEIPGQNWPDCPYCQAVAQMLEASKAPAIVPTGTGWPVAK